MLALLLLCSAALAFDAEALDEHIGAFGEHWGPTHEFSGYVHVWHAGETVYSKGFGYADRDAERPNGPDTTFRIGSLTKQFAATTVLRLQEQGKLDTAAPISTYVADFPHELSLHQLLTHTSGVWSYTSDRDFIKRAAQPHTTAEMVEWFAGHELDFEPGAEFSYSNSGYVLVGAAIEAGSGKSWSEAAKELAFDPAGLLHTTVGDGTSTDSARPYRANGDRVVDAMPIDMSVPHAAGNIRSTANDLVRWHQALGTDAVLTADSRERLFTPEKNSYAYGWFVRGKSVCHGGGIFGFNTFFCRVPHEDLVVVAWTNNDAFGVDAVGDAALASAMGQPFTRHTERPVLPFDKKAAKALRGTYALSEEGRAVFASRGLPPPFVETVATVSIDLKGSELDLDPIGQGALRLYRGDGIWFTKQAGVVVRETDGGFVMEQRGLEIPYDRQ